MWFSYLKDLGGGPVEAFLGGASLERGGPVKKKHPVVIEFEISSEQKAFKTRSCDQAGLFIFG